MNIVIQLLLSTLTAPSPAPTDVGDLCDVVDANTGTPTICKPHEEGAPVFDADVCCRENTCLAAPVDGCQEREKLHYCWLGEVTQTDEVACYFEVPDYCDVHICPSQVAPYPWEDEICCQWDYCIAITVYNAGFCQVEDIYACASLVSNPDGSVTCVDDE